MRDFSLGKIRFQAASDCSLLVCFGEEISAETHHQIVRFLQLLKTKPVDGVLNVHPAYSSVLVKFEAAKFDHAQIESRLASYLPHLNKVKLLEPRLREIPVCYGGEFGPDLEEVASSHGVSTAEIVRLHSSAKYTVCFLGFVPGFAYLGGLPPRLATPRLAAPRKRVPAGSVAIGGNQAGVYPISTPGGWRLIGRTPVKIFNPEATEMSYLAIGDEVRFVQVSEGNFYALERQ